MSSRKRQRGSRSARSETIKHHRKTHQLCAQAQRALAFAFAESEEFLVSDLIVLDVVPHPGVTRLLAVVQPSIRDEFASPRQIKEALARQRGNLRAAVAATINRKRTPMIVFEVL